MDKPGEKYISQHKRIAMGDPDPFERDNFGVAPLSSHAAGGPATTKTSSYLKDDERSARSPIGGNQANADHGPVK